jgi:hypothetical protein
MKTIAESTSFVTVETSEDELNKAAMRYVEEQRELDECRLMGLHTWFCYICGQLTAGKSHWIPWDELLELIQSSNDEYGTKDVLKGLLWLMFEQLKEAAPYLNFEFDKEREGVTLYPSVLP